MDTNVLDRICLRFRARLKTMQIQTGLARVALLGLLLLPAVFFMDWWAHLSTAWRLTALILWVAALAAVFWRTLWRPMGQRWTNEQILFYIDSVSPPDRRVLLELYELVGSKDDIKELDSEIGQDLI